MILHRFSLAAAFFALLMVLGAGAARAQLFETKAAQAFMIDAETGTILFSKDADKLIPPASLGKLMTMEVVFNALKTGRLSLDDVFQVSENEVWNMTKPTSGTSGWLVAGVQALQ